MFLEMTKERNHKLIEVSTDLHQQGVISPNTYVLDLDTVKNNAMLLDEEAKKQDIELLFMTKQFGRNPVVANAIVEAGIQKAVAVDPWEAITLSNANIQIGHVGHIVQIPKKMIPTILNLNPDYITVFSYENAKNISDTAIRLGKIQKVYLRIANDDDYIYNGQEGGFSLKSLKDNVKKIEQLQGIQIAGLTSFPCLLIQNSQPIATSNVKSMQKAKQFLIKRGHHDLEMNMPSATSTASLELLKQLGATQGEPGHALTGTTPIHAIKSLKEKPAMVYVSEVSHVYNNKSYVFGGGFYPRSHMKHALVGSNFQQMKKVSAIENEPSSIDYYGGLDTSEVNVGDTAIFAFRTQMFVTNAQIAIIENLKNSPRLIGIYDTFGNLLTDNVNTSVKK
ncbi:YhfX family PLP-dependent enzyme [Paraliobacillus sp. JSM ZJ581]|uniref:YhfX family PLP-dependent enzyme n=1 Tax=Paraliobacillus sp. JSM ZJ581 TaxID=3342118 RepID=UPI0035A9855B